MPTDAMTPDWGPAITEVRAQFPNRRQYREPFRSVTAVDMQAAIKLLPRVRLNSDRPLLMWQVIWWLAAKVAADRRQPRPSESAVAEIMRTCRIGERAAYRMLEKHHAPRVGRRFVLDTAARARIHHDMTTRALRHLVAVDRRPTNEREWRSAQEYALRHVPAIRPEPLTGQALVEAFLSLETAFPGHVTRGTKSTA